MPYAMNASHPLFASCVFACATETVNNPPDLVSGLVPTVNGTVGVVTHEGKQCLQFDGSSFLSWPTHFDTSVGTGLDLLTTTGSLFVIAQTDIDAALSAIISSVDDVVTTQGISGFYFDDSLNVNAMSLRTSDGNTPSDWNIEVPLEGSLQTVMVTWNGLDHLYYALRSGVGEAWGVGVVGAPIPSQARRHTQLAKGYGGSQLTGKIALAYAFSGVLTLTQFQSLAADPYALVSAGAPTTGGILLQMMHHGLYAHA
jgi:hypothetical protein